MSRPLALALPLALLVAALPAAPLAAQDGDKARPKQTVLKVSKQTTYITQPLDEEGYVDYVRAVNERQSVGATPENNFENVVRRVHGPDDISEELRLEYYGLIGMTPTKGTLVNFFDFAARQEPRPSGATDEVQRSLNDEFKRVMDAPWAAADHPRAAKWLERMQAPLDDVVEGARRTHYYTPYLAGEADDEEGPYPAMISLLLPSVQGQRELARCLLIRANMRIHSGDLAGAWSDAHAMQRMARLSGKGGTLIEGLVGIAIDGMAHQPTANILRSPRLTDALARQMLADLQQLSSHPSMADKIDVFERFGGLDAVQTIARHGAGNMFKLLNMIQSLSSVEEQGELATMFVVHDGARGLAGVINWNVTAELMNKWYDRLVKAAREPDFEQRKAQFAAIDADIKKLAANARDSRQIMRRLLLGSPPDEFGKMIGEILVALLLPASNSVSQAEYQAITRQHVLLLAVAAEVHRRETGAYPAQLASLAPKYVAQVELDQMSGKPLHYRRIGRGFQLYSVGRNGVDDNGRGYDDRPEGQRVDWDDLGVKVER